jgi:hypothetical protein
MKLIAILLLPFACIAGTWTDLGPGTLFSSTCTANSGSCVATGGCTSSNYAFLAQCSNRIDSWSGGDVYSNGTKFFISGGGHADYLGNEVASANLVSKTIANIYPPSCFNFSGSGTTPCSAYVQTSSTTPSFDKLPDGSPMSRHTYGGVVCVDRHSTCYQFSGGPYPGTVARYMWEWPMSGTTATNWVQTTQFSTTAASPNTLSCADYPTADALYCVVGTTGPQSLYSYSYSSHTWTPIVPNGFSGGVGPFAATMLIDNTRKIAVFVGNSQDPASSTGGMAWLDLTGSDGWVYHDVTSTASATCQGLILAEYPGLAFDPNDNMIVGKAQEASTIYILNPQTWTCSTDNPAGTPANATTSHGLFGRWRYSAALNGFVTLNEWNQNVFIYRRDYGAPTDTTPPTVPTGLVASAVSSSAINLAWTPSTDNVGVTGYRIYRGGALVANSLTPSYSDSGLTASTLYTYTVAAYDAAGNVSGQSAAASATTQASSSGGTSGGINGLGRSTLTCVDRDGDGYGVGPVALGALTDLHIDPAPLGTMSAPSVSVVGATGSTTYYYFISQCTAGPAVSCTAPSPGAAVTTANATLSGSNYVHVTWPDTSAAGYMLFRSTSSTVPVITGNQVYGVPSCSAGTCTVNDQNNASLSTAVAPSAFVSSVGHSFTSADIGRVIHITSGANFTLRDGVSIQTVVSGSAGLSSVVGPAAATSGHWQIDGCLGPDADDLDASVHTGAQAIAKWGTLKAFFAHQGYSPTRFWWIDPVTGNDANTCHDTDASSASSTPCQTLNHVVSAGLAGGDMAILRQGTYTEVLSSVAQGSTNAPVIYADYPGERSTWTAGAGWGLIDKSWFILDGPRVICVGNAGTGFNGGTDDYQTSSLFHDNIFRHIESTNCSDGMYSFNGMLNLTIEDSNFHDQHGVTGHGLYIGARNLPNKNVTVRRNLLYGNDYSGMQHNGRVTNLVVEQNIVYSNRLVSGISLENGTSQSFIRSNLIFSNQKAGLIFAIYDYDYHRYPGQASCVLELGGNCDCSKPNMGYCPYDQTFNLIENNTFYQTGYDRDGNPTSFGAIVINAQDTDFPRDMGHNTFRNNIFYAGPDGNHTPLFSYFNEIAWNPEADFSQEAAWFATSTWEKNIIKQSIGSNTNVLTFYDNNNHVYTSYGCSAMAGITTFPNGASTDCKNIDPQFVAASTSYYNSPSNFNFTPAPGSPVIGAGASAGVPPTDLWGAIRPSPPSLGAVEAAAGGVTGGPPAVSSVVCSPTFLGANATSNCTVVLSQAASTGGATIALSTSTPALTTPGSVVVPAGNSTAGFAAASGAISNNGPAVVTASLNASSQTTSVTLLGCDLNGDGVVNNLDVQIAIAQAVGTGICNTADLLQTGQCSVVDVQRVINASLGGACKIGPSL